jgi:hypothetical protein
MLTNRLRKLQADIPTDRQVFPCTYRAEPSLESSIPPNRSSRPKLPVRRTNSPWRVNAYGALIY